MRIQEARIARTRSVDLFVISLAVIVMEPVDTIRPENNGPNPAVAIASVIPHIADMGVQSSLSFPYNLIEAALLLSASFSHPLTRFL